MALGARLENTVLLPYFLINSTRVARATQRWLWVRDCIRCQKRVFDLVPSPFATFWFNFYI